MKMTNDLFWRGITLFTIGTVLTFVLELLQTRQQFLSHGSPSWNRICLQWWLPLLCGAGSAIVGLIYPRFKSKDPDVKSQEWSHVLRCVAIFMGINEACTKVEFPSFIHLSISLAVLSIGLWWYFDRTPFALGLGIIVATIATLIAEVLVYNQICINTSQEFSYLKAWLPSIMFSGSITISNIGERLSLNDPHESKSKSHTE